MAFAQNCAMTDAIDPFVRSLEREAPPPGATPIWRAVWHGLRSNCDAAHEIAQAQDDAAGAWVHAWLHRIEGDLGNADYWYRRESRPPCRDDTRDEGLDRSDVKPIVMSPRESAHLIMCRCHE